MDTHHPLAGQSQSLHRSVSLGRHVGPGQQSVHHLVTNGVAVMRYLQPGQHAWPQARYALQQLVAGERQNVLALAGQVAALAVDEVNLVGAAGKQVSGPGVKHASQHLFTHQLGVQVAGLPGQMHHHTGAFAGHRHRAVRSASGPCRGGFGVQHGDGGACACEVKSGGGAHNAGANNDDVGMGLASGHVGLWWGKIHYQRLLVCVPSHP